MPQLHAVCVDEYASPSAHGLAVISRSSFEEHHTSMMIVTTPRPIGLAAKIVPWRIIRGDEFRLTLTFFLLFHGKLWEFSKFFSHFSEAFVCSVVHGFFFKGSVILHCAGFDSG